MTLKDKMSNSVVSSKLKREQNVKRGISDSGLPDFEFRERTPDFSLKYREIRPSAVVGTRREAALRGESFSWVPDLRSFDKLREVGVSPYLGFILCLRAMLMFELNEVVRGCLIGLKSWDRIVIIFRAIFTVHGLCVWTVWAVCVMIYALNHVVMCMRP